MEKSVWTSIFEIESQDLNHTWHLDFDSSIIPELPEQGWKEYLRKTLAEFQCTRCHRRWPSNRVMVVFHMRLMEDKGIVKVRPFRQNCKKCRDAPMEEPSITPERITILLQNLVKKIRIKCYHENLNEGNHIFEGINVNNPHEPDHCEGCMAGICTRA
ncbi:receptor-transporting protein 3-like [Toxotes jaculatrix]|uniref:receptor-transporting protein 3-like n=1 Tax=Toxotes jaculatrix TaxID=941984 RepID=UPI001B3AAB63|nr:receptor-transporting protein 3-like [Toxotes jaculatrix]